MGCGKMSDLVEIKSVETGGVAKAGTGMFKAETGNSEDVDNGGAVVEVVSKRCKSSLESWKTTALVLGIR